MNNTLKTSLVLCDLDHLLLGTDGNLPQVLRDVMQLFNSRGGRLTVFSQRSPKAVRTILGSVRLAAPALVCGGTLAYQFATGTGQPLCSFAGREEAVLQKLPSAVGLGIGTADDRRFYPCAADERGAGSSPAAGVDALCPQQCCRCAGRGCAAHPALSGQKADAAGSFAG